MFAVSSISSMLPILFIIAVIVLGKKLLDKGLFGSAADLLGLGGKNEQSGKTRHISKATSNNNANCCR